jgi:hypothetical protein
MSLDWMRLFGPRTPVRGHVGDWTIEFYCDDPHFEEICHVLEAIMLGYIDD